VKKYLKKSYMFFTVSLLIGIFVIGIYNYKQPITFHKTVNAIIRPNPINDSRAEIILKQTTAVINAKMYKGTYSGLFDNKIHFSIALKGTIIVDNKEYSFTGSSPESNPNWFLCYTDNEGIYSGFILHDLTVIELFK